MKSPIRSPRSDGPAGELYFAVMACHTRILHLLTALLCVPGALCAQIRVIGLPPTGITSHRLEYEYRRIFHQLAPHLPLDTRPLTVEYFLRRDLGGHADALPEWGGGGAIGTHSILVALDPLPFLRQDLYQTTLHELTHIALTRIAGTTHLPRWFHEGTALLLSGDIDRLEQTIISRAIFTGSLMALQSIDSVNAFGRSRAQLAYCQSRQALLTIVDTWGMEGLQTVVAQVARQRDFARALDSALAVTPREFEDLAVADLHRRFSPLSWLADAGLVWIFIVTLFFIALIVTLVRNRRARRLLELDLPLSKESQAEQTGHAEETPSGTP